jgi:Fe-Mn family superoxide dismutase
MAFSLPELSYNFEDLEHFIDRETMKAHYTKFHGSYVKVLNWTVKKYKIEEECLVTLLSNIKKSTKYDDFAKESLIYNGGGHLNHSLFWCSMSPDSEAEDIKQDLAVDLRSDFGSITKFCDKFGDEAHSFQGSGALWLISDRTSETLKIKSTKNNDNPIMFNENHIPLIGLDLWEHAYYHAHKNKRYNYVSNWEKVFNWKFLNSAYEKYVVEGKKFEMTPDGKFNV